MSEHSPASTSEFSTIYPQRAALDQQRSTSAETLTRHAREQASQAGEYVARNVQEYPFGALLLAGLIGYGIGYLIHGGWSSETRQMVWTERFTTPRGEVGASEEAGPGASACNPGPAFHSATDSTRRCSSGIRRGTPPAAASTYWQLRQPRRLRCREPRR